MGKILGNRNIGGRMNRKRNKYEVIVPEDQRIFFENLMKDFGFSARDTGFFYVADLDAWLKDKQKPIEE